MKAAQKNPIPSKRVLPLPAALTIIIQVLDALNYAHTQEIVHRDIKPGNIMIEKHSNRPLVMDFGIVQVLRGKGDDKPIVHGTPLYMPPEQILSREVDGRADIYAVAVMFYQMLVTRLPLPPFKSKPALLKEKVLNKKGVFLQWPSEVNPALHADLDPIMQKALAYSPDDRYATCNDFREDLIAYQKNHVG